MQLICSTKLIRFVFFVIIAAYLGMNSPVLAQTSDVTGGNAFDRYYECMRKCAIKNRTCLAELAAMEAARDARDAACRSQAQSEYDTMIAACPNATVDPIGHAACVQNAEARRAQLLQGCDTQKAQDQAEIDRRRSDCSTEQARCRAICARDFCAAVKAAQTQSGTPPSSSIVQELFSGDECSEFADVLEALGTENNFEEFLGEDATALETSEE